MQKTCDIVVIGAGPGGYAAAFYAADCGKSVVLVEQDDRLGGVCLNRGCIPSKALLHASEILSTPDHAKEMGIHFSTPTLDLDKLRNWKNSIVQKLSNGIQFLAKKRNITVLKGRAHFNNPQSLRVDSPSGQTTVTFEQAIIATGSRPALPELFNLGSKRIMTSTEALDIDIIPSSLLVIGGGYIGMELGTVYAELGSAITLVEAGQSLLGGADSDLARPVIKYAKTHFKEIKLNTKIVKMATLNNSITATFETADNTYTESFEKVLVSIGRLPNSENMGLENTQVLLDDKGYIQVNTSQQTADPSIFAIGDIAGGLLLAHKASREARVAINTICGKTVLSNPAIPAVVFTHPEIAWVGLTEVEASQKNISIKIASFPWVASGRALTLGDREKEGLTKLIIDPETERILGVGIVGKGAGDLISEGALAIEMGATAYDITQTIHPHPTLSETMMEAAEIFYGHCTHV